MEINIDTVLAVIGVIATVLIGYIGVKYTIKHQKKTNIVFLKNSCISLFKTIVRNLDDIEINFQGKKIDENLILFKGTFFNNGNVDIDKSIIHKPLEIELPSGFSWVTHKIIEASDNLEVTLTQDGNKLLFNWDLFKEGEYITFDCLVEYKHNPDEKEDSNYNLSKAMLDGIKFNHRITNLKKVNKEGSIPNPPSTGASIFVSLIFLVVICGGYYVAIGQYFSPSYKLLYEVSIDSEQYHVELVAKDEKNISMLSFNEEEIKTIPIDDVSKYLTQNSHIKKVGINYWYLIGAGFVSTIYLIMFFAMLASDVKNRRLYKKLKSVVDKHDDLEYGNYKDPISLLFK